MLDFKSTPEVFDNELVIDESQQSQFESEASSLPTPRYAVYEGGGIKGVVYGGGLGVLEKTGLINHIEKVGGSSVGAITALIIALGWKSDRVTKTLGELDFKGLAEGGWWDKIKAPFNMIFRHGAFSGHGIDDWLGEIIGEVTGNPDITFEEFEKFRQDHPELSLKSIYVTGTDTNTKSAIIFSHESEYKDVSVRKGVKSSMCFPGFFMPEEVKNHFIKDGGMINNCPYSLFEEEGKYNSEILIFRADSKMEIEHFQKGIPFPYKPINTFFENCMVDAKILASAQDFAFHNSHYKKRNTIFCGTLDVDTLDFGLSKETVAALVASGEFSAIHYLSKQHPELLYNIYSEKFLKKVQNSNATTISDFLDYKASRDDSIMRDGKEAEGNLENPRKRWKELPYFKLKREEAQKQKEKEVELTSSEPSYATLQPA